MKFYFLGIGGIAMGSAAILMKKNNFEVLGSDSKVYPPMSDLLNEASILFYENFDIKNISNFNPDIVVIGNSISRGNIELEWILNNRLSIISLPDLIKSYFILNKRSIVVTGTHGKTTTASILAYILLNNDLKPSWFIGGTSDSLKTNACLDLGNAFVIEGDEYDSAFFDKRSKFIHYNPYVVSVNNLEMDHSDIFSGIEEIKRSFKNLFQIIPSNGSLVINGDDEVLLSIKPNWCNLFKVGIGPDNDLIIKNFKDHLEGSSFDLYYKETLWAKINWGLHGLFNARNAAIAAMPASIINKYDRMPLLDLTCINDFKGVSKRQDFLFQSKDILIVDDFGHHPTALLNTINSFRDIYIDYDLIVCFEPRSNTSKTNLFQSEFARSLSIADHVKIGKVYNKERMNNKRILDTYELSRSLINEVKSAEAYDDNAKLLESLYKLLKSNKESKKKSLVLFFTNGDFDGISKKLVNYFLKD